MDSDDDFRLPLKVKAGTAITTRSRARTVKKDSKKRASKSMDISKPKETAAVDAVTISDDEGNFRDRPRQFKCFYIILNALFQNEN